jgi:ectoine hydroxylase-related dioxygenase (phytanoyl-CoA dioxygenase family)
MSSFENTVAQHLRELHEEGVTVVKRGVDLARVQRIRQQFKAFADLNGHLFHKHLDADGHYPRIINLHLAFRPLIELFTENPVALAVQDAFFGRPSAIYTTLYYERGSAQPLHRDTPYFCTRPEYNYLGVWVALEDANAKNGCLNVVRGGHLVPEFDREKIALQHYPSLDEVPGNSEVLWNTYQQMVIDRCAELGLKTELVEVEAGDTVIWHPQLPHGGSHIEDITRTRHSLVLHVTPVGVPVYYQDVFFNPSKPVPEQAPWAYLDFGNRQYVAHSQVEFAHKDPTSPALFKQL